MEKEKSKNRTDLLAAGRKKLQQFRQKKDGKGNKHGKSSDRSVDPEHVDADDANETSTVVNSTTKQLDPQGQLKSPREVSIPHSMENFGAGAICNHELLLHCSPGDEGDVGCMEMSQSAISQTADVEASKILSSEIHDVPVTKGIPVQSQVLIPVDSTCNALADASEGVTARVDEISVDEEAQKPEDLASEQSDNIVADSSEVDRFQNSAESNDSESSKREDLLANREGVSDSEGYEGTILSKKISNGEPSKTKTKSLSGELSSTSLDLSSIGFLQLKEVLKGDSGSSAETINNISNFMVSECASSVLEKFKDQLILTTIAKDFFQLQFCEQSELQVEFEQQHYQLVDQISVLSNSLNEIQEKNKCLSEELACCRSEMHIVTGKRAELQNLFDSARVELEAFSGSSDELKVKYEHSQMEMVNLSVDLAICKSLLADAQLEKENLNGSLSLVTTERVELVKENEYLVNDNERLLLELADYESFVESLRMEHSNLSERFNLITGEKNKLDEEKAHLVNENEKLLMERVDYQGLVNSLELERANFVEKLSHMTEERKKLMMNMENIIYENERLSIELLVHVEVLSMEHEDRRKLELDLEVKKLHFKQATEAAIIPHSSLGMHEPMLDGPWAAKKHASSPLKGHLREAEMIMQKLDMATEQMHSLSASLSRPGGKMAAPGISKLIQAFESKVHLDDFATQEVNFTNDQSSTDLLLLAKEQTGNLRTVLAELQVDVENNDGKMFKEARDCRELANCSFDDLKDRHDILVDHSNNLEARNVELEVLCEYLKQHLCHIERAHNGFEVLYETILQQDASLKTENFQLVKKLNTCYSRVCELQTQLNEMQTNSDKVAKSIYFQLENLHKETFDRTSLLEHEWICSAAQIAEAIEKLDTFVHGLPTTIAGTQDSLVMGTSVVTSVDAAIQLIKNLQGKHEATCTDLEHIHGSYEEINEKYFYLCCRNGLFIDMLCKIHGDLRKLVMESGGFAEENDKSIENERFDPPHLSSYETFTGKLGDLLSEKRLLESDNSKLNLEMIKLTNDFEELKHRSLDLSTICMLIEDVESVIKLDGEHIDSNELPISRLLSLVRILVQRYREASEQVQLSREKFELKVMELDEMEGMVQALYTSDLHHGNEVLILKESLSQAEEAFANVRSDLMQKAAELEQSEQRVSSVREKLSIAVAKGKGLILQRDNLKQSLAEATHELERCSKESKLKDARLSDVELKLKMYSESGERVKALESELSYIRTSATALRESFLHKDSILQRIEEVLEDLELPENFHSRDIIEKVNWLARSVAGNSLPLIEWDQKSSVGGASYSDGSFVITDGCKEDVHPSTTTVDDMRRKFEELESKFYGLAEQNEMLEQSLMERNNLVQRWEEVLDRINIPSQLQSMEPEDRIEWLGSAFSEAHHISNLLQQKIDYLETYCGSLTSDLDESRKQISNLENERISERLENLTHENERILETSAHLNLENERISERLENLIHENERILETSAHLKLENDRLQEELNGLHANLDRMNIIESGIKRLQGLIIDVLQDGDENLEGIMSIESLEKLLKKLIGKYEMPVEIDDQSLDETDVFNARELEVVVLKNELEEVVENLMHVRRERDEYIDKHQSWVHEIEVLNNKCQKLQELLDQEETDVFNNARELEVVVLKNELEEVVENLMHVRCERDEYIDKHQSWVHEVEVLNNKCQKLQELLDQEENKSASLREKLNVAVRKGKSLVQQRDGLKLNIEELSAELNHSKAEISHHERKINELGIFPERVEALESENLFLKNHLAETEQSLREKEHTVSRVTNALHDIDFGNDVNISDPHDMIENLGKAYLDLKSAVASSEHELRKSRRAAELLLAELNEVQERNDALQEELEKAAVELSKVSNERDLAETAKAEACQSVEQSLAVHSEERNFLIAKFFSLKSFVDLLGQALSDASYMLDAVSSKDMELLHSVAAAMDSCLKPIGAIGLIDLSCLITPTKITPMKLENEENLLAESFECQIGDSISETEIFSFVQNYLQQFTKEVDSFKSKIHGHSISVNEEAKRLSEVMGTLWKEMASQKGLVNLLETETARLESILKQKDSENVLVCRNFAVLQEACSSSILEIENRKQQFSRNGASGDLAMTGMNAASESPLCPVEEDISVLASRLLLAVKDFANMQTDIVEGQMKVMKVAISNLQNELQKKDAEKERTSMALVSQIKEAEAVAKRTALNLKSVEAQVHDLEEERISLAQRLEDVQEREVSVMELQQRISSLTDALAEKEQESESLMQALEEEEVQMEELTKKKEDLDKAVQQKNIDLENLEASRTKIMNKLSITVTKFDELHHLSGDLLAEVEKLQSQLQDRDTEISFLRREVTRCMNDVLVASQTSSERNSDEIYGLLASLEAVISRVEVSDLNLDGIKDGEINAYKEMLQKQIASIVSELEDKRIAIQSRDALLQAERDRAEKLLHRGNTLEAALTEESRLNLLHDMKDHGRPTTTTSEILEVEPAVNKWPAHGPSITPQVRSLRKVNNDQVAIAVGTDPDGNGMLEDGDDDKVHGFKLLTTSRIVPRFTRPVTDMIDGLWVSCDRALMRQPALRMAIIIYWAVLHSLLAAFIV